ncbi:MAG: iron ABC transporter permease [Gammaproteobacteria bacterium]|nr:iron ABC transporter permease [Gammaproteobacteria bacterium]
MAAHQSALARYSLILLTLAALCLGALLLSLATGSVSLSFTDVWWVLLGDESSMAATVVNELRLPRALAALATGGLLALAGALMQVLLRNPLADPYVLGVSGGASLVALLCLSLGTATWLLTLGSFAGALLSMLLVFALAHGRGSWTPTRLLLTGVVVAAGWGALISFVLAVAADNNLRGMLFWLMGDLSHVTEPGLALAVLLVGTLLAWMLARELNVLAYGELRASALGVNVRRLRYAIYFLASLLAGAAVSLAGSVGFVGLIVPHLMRLLVGSDHRILLPASVFAGALLVLLADTLARTVIAPEQLPVGVITALVGVPLFLLLLNRTHRL